jgi:predicted GNAT superfamily acetyltransferase
MPDSEIVVIRPAETIADFLACQEVQIEAFGITEGHYVVPVATLVGAQLHGGLVLGAFTDSGRSLGFSFGFLGKVEGELCLYSQITCIRPGSQGLGLGTRLKEIQRNYARKAGLSRIAWAFDPLQTGNANLNLNRLGATSQTFVENMYGLRTDALNQNATTDRLIVVWEIDSEPLEKPRLDLASIPRLIEVDDGPEARLEGKLDGPIALLEVPADIKSMRKQEPTLAGAWAGAVRESFQAAFGAGFRAEAFLREDDGRCSYILQKK